MLENLVNLIPIDIGFGIFGDKRFICTPVWNRLEASPIGDDITRSVRAEIRDPLWMLSRQWQFGEFAGDDAGTPVYADLEYCCGTVSRDVPLEAVIETQPLFPSTEPKWKTLYLRIQMGCYWFQLLDDANASV